jgi:hypothetical protein
VPIEGRCFSRWRLLCFARSRPPIVLNDPVLNAQDPGDPGDSYVIVKATYGDGACSVELHSKFRNTSDVAIVVPELRFEQGRWVFVNFHYPDSTDKRSENLRNLIKNYLAPSPTSP